MSEKLVEIKDLEISFGEGSKKFVAVKNANFFINKGETFSLVGESARWANPIFSRILSWRFAITAGFSTFGASS